MKTILTIILAFSLCVIGFTSRAQSPQPKVYRALLTQSEENAPTANVITNTLGGTVVLGREAAGEYTLTLAGAFSGDVVYRFPGSEEGFDNSRLLVREIHDDYILIVSQTGNGTGSGVDNVLGQVTRRGTPIEILVY